MAIDALCAYMRRKKLEYYYRYILKRHQGNVFFHRRIPSHFSYLKKKISFA